MTEFPPQFDFASAEREIYERWERAGAFSAGTARSTRGGGPVVVDPKSL